MSFISLEFLIFFLVVVALYFNTPFRWRWALLLGSSYIFYGYWSPIYIVLKVFVTTVSFGAGWWIGRSDNQRVRLTALLVSLIALLGTLFVFKYFNFFNDSMDGLFTALGWNYPRIGVEVILPLGISFYIFQAISYVIDVYRRDLEAQRHWGYYALYISFFPQLVAGPIERAGHIIPQFLKEYDFDDARVVDGLRLILWGVFKKVVIADRLAIYVNAVYSNVGEFSGVPLLVATFFFAFQIYCDFSAYSDIAIGTARVLGISLMDNFRQPYLSLSVREFWRRWHISLSSWFRDYLYIPLGGSRISFGRTLFNLMMVFVVSGLWHGANWTFIIWGALHGGYVVLESLLERWSGRPKLPAFLRLLATFILVCFAWIFFRADSLEDAGYVTANLFNFSDGGDELLDPFEDALFPAQWELGISVSLIALLLLVDWIDAQRGFIRSLGQSPGAIRWAVYYALAFAITASLWIYVTGTQEFIYFQF